MRHDAATDLAVPVVDTNGRALRLCTDATTHPAVAARVISSGNDRIHLEVLAASHRVRVLCGSDAIITETVACDVSEALTDVLPVAAEWHAAGRTMHFSSTTTEGAAAVRSAVEAIDDLDAARSLVVRFPGHELAFTAIEVVTGARSGDTDRTKRETAGAESISWRTWHLYPGADPHVVTTETTARLQPAAISTHRPRLTELQGVS